MCIRDRSTITAIDPGLYEAAAVDGAGRFRKIWHVTLPAMLPLIVIQLILSIGNMLSANTDLILLLYNSSTYKTADVIGTYVYRETLMGGKFSYGTASGQMCIRDRVEGKTAHLMLPGNSISTVILK